MSWYTAHVIQYYEFKQRPQEYYPFYENVILIQADSDEQAWTLAEHYVQERSEGDAYGTLVWDGIPAIRRYAGVRKVISLPNPKGEPQHGVELTYSLFHAESWEDLQKLVAGEAVRVKYIE